MKVKSGIYAIRNTANGKCYVGSAANLKSRWCQHKHALIKNSHYSKHMQAAWNKYGMEVFEFIILEFVESKNLLLEREQYWIESTDSVASGYNIRITASSQLGMKHSQEAKRKMSISRRGRKHSAETRARISAGQIGKNIAAETREKIRIAKLGIKHSSEAREKMSASRTGLKQSAETVAKRIAAQVGKPLSPEHKANISAGQIEYYKKTRLLDPLSLRQTREHVEKREASRLATLRAKKLVKMVEDRLQ